MKRAFGKFLDIVFPRHCLSCGRENPRGKYKYLCEDCASAPFSCNVPRCRRCAEIVGGEISTASCPKCEAEYFNFSEAMVACEYAAAGRELVLELKYRSGLWAASDIAVLASQAPRFAEFFENSIIVPVPLSSKRMRKRGYNQSEVIARAVSKKFKDKNVCVARLLNRKRHTDTQTALTREERERNVKGAFELRKNEISKDARIIILDDVITSGATLNECAKVLKRAGFKDIRVFAFARRS